MIILGTANFGNTYGTVGEETCLGSETIKSILSIASESTTILGLDTSPDYGSSERIIGSLDTGSLIINTKIHFEDIQFKNLERFFVDQLEKSLLNLNLQKINTLFFHRAYDLHHNNSHAKELCKLISKYRSIYFDTAGVSIYEPKDLEEIYSDEINQIQLPINILDRRWDNNCVMKAMKSRRVKFQARSIFMRGALLRYPKKQNIPEQVRSAVSMFHKHCHINKLDPLTVCLQNVIENELIDEILIGVDNVKQLSEILEKSQINKLINQTTPLAKLADHYNDLRNW